MKQVLSFCILCIISYSALAQNVGIGTTTPLQRLHVKGPVRLDPAGATGDAILNFYGATTNDQSYIYFYNQLSAVSPAAYFGYSAPSDYSIWSNGSTSVYLKSEGLGIGTNAPLTKLQVATGQDAGFGASQNGHLMIGLSTTANLIMDGNEIMSRNNGRKTDLFLQNDSGNVVLCGNNQGFVNVASSIGLGTSNPSTRLHIPTGSDAGSSHNTPGFILLGNSSSGNSLAIDNNEIAVRNTVGGGMSGSDLFLQNDAGDVILCGSENGAVGIGVLSGASIPAGFLLAVDGKIISEELKVQLSTNWPDYVFDNTYKLRSFDELRKFIADNKHLPNIPSASEVEKNGIEVGDMQKRMMEKIEELTLYILELEKKVSKLEAAAGKN